MGRRGQSRRGGVSEGLAPKVIHVLRALLVALLAFTALGCSAGTDTLEVRAWTLQVPSHDAVSLTLPARIDTLLPDSPTTYTLRGRVSLPDPMRGRALTLAVPYLHARATASAGGTELMPLDDRMLDGYRGTHQPAWRIPAELASAGSLELELRVDYENVLGSRLDAVPRISATVSGDPGFRAVRAANAVTSMACLAIALALVAFHGVVFLRGRGSVAYGWFALQALAGGAGDGLLESGWSQYVFGRYENTCVSLLLCVGVVASVKFTHAQLDLGRTSRAWPLSLAVIAIIAVVTRSPFLGPRILPPANIAMVAAVVVYQAIVTGRAWRRERRAAALVIGAAWLVLGVLSIPDQIAYLGLGEVAAGLRGGCLGLVAFSLIQATVLAGEYQRALLSAARLNDELRERIGIIDDRSREVARLNEELRRQIAARAKRLAESLPDLDERAAPIDRGSIILGRYQVERLLGAGGMGVVYEVIRRSDGRRFALKTLKAKADKSALSRFAREAEIASQLDHENLVTTIDVDLLETGAPFIVMDYVDGPSLDRVTERFGDVEWSVTVLRQIAAALSALHARGVIHRDLKPANILLARNVATPLVKVTDFGISRMLDRAEDIAAGDTIDASAGASADLTRTGVIMGTPMYMAPELLRGARHATPAADIYSFGVVAHEVLVGVHTLRASRAFQAAASTSFTFPPSVPKDLRRTLERCGDPPQGRPDAATLLRALEKEDASPAKSRSRDERAE